MDRSRSPSGRRFRSLVVASLLVLGIASPIAPVLGLASANHSAPSLSSTVDYVNLSANPSLTWTPNHFSVYPGALVHLVVTQNSSFEHTFDLSSVANYTFPSSDNASDIASFFSAHPPLVNLTLGSGVMGHKYYANFTAPAVGTYEYLCSVHFPGMTGVMTSAVPAPPPPSPPGGTSPVFYWVAGGVVAVIIVAGVVVALRRGRDRDIKL